MSPNSIGSLFFSGAFDGVILSPSPRLVKLPIIGFALDVSGGSITLNFISFFFAYSWATDLLYTIKVSDSQPENALSAMVSTSFGIVSHFISLHPLNALALIAVTVSGMATSSRLEQEENALFPMVVAPSIRVTEVIYFRGKYFTWFVLLTVISLIPLQPLKAVSSTETEAPFTVKSRSRVQSAKARSAIYFTDFGRFITSKLVHSSNAHESILCNVSGKSTLVRAAFRQNVPSPVLFTPLGITTVLRFEKLKYRPEQA